MSPYFQTMLIAGIVMMAPTSFAVPEDLSAQDAQRQSYVRAVANHFQVAESEAHILLEGRMVEEELPVLLLLARETGIAPTALLASRRGGMGWFEVGTRFDMNPARLHVDVSPDAAGPELERAVRLFRDTPTAQWSQMSLTDDEVIGLVHVKVLSLYLRVPPDRILDARATVGSWVGIPSHLARP